MFGTCSQHQARKYKLPRHDLSWIPHPYTSFQVLYWWRLVSSFCVWTFESPTNANIVRDILEGKFLRPYLILKILYGNPLFYVWMVTWWIIVFLFEKRLPPKKTNMSRETRDHFKKDISSNPTIDFEGKKQFNSFRGCSSLTLRMCVFLFLHVVFFPTWKP